MKLLILFFLSSATVGQVSRPWRDTTQGGVASAGVDRLLRDLLFSSNRNTVLTSSVDSRSNLCLTPDGQRGECLPLSQCNAFVPYYSVISHPNVLNFFRERICRLLTTEIHLCCPRSPSNQSRESLDQPSVSRQPVSLTEENCGIPSGDRIVGGDEVEVGRWPWLAAVGLPREGTALFFRICAGTLISKRHVLSAAHCFTPDLPQSTHVRLGEHSLSRNDDGTIPQDVRIKSRLFFGYNNNTRENDIILLTLEQDVSINDFVSLACLPTSPPERDSSFEGEEMTVVGWGRLAYGDDSPTSDVPREVNIPVRSLAPCSSIYSSRGYVVDRKTLCAGQEGKDSCGGDSGGPLNYLSPRNRRYYLVGIVSHGIECARAEYPAVYTRVGAFMNWIISNLN